MSRRDPKYRDREEAGEILASRLSSLTGQDPIVLAIPNGGVAVGAPIARSLGCGLCLLVVRKIQIPGMTEAGFGAVAADGTTVWDEKLLGHLGLSQDQVEYQTNRALHSIRARLGRFGPWAKLPPLGGKTAILVDDGLATGSTMEAAITIVRSRGPQCVVVAVPTSSRRAYLRVKSLESELVCPDVSGRPIFAVADAYANWFDLTEDQVLHLLESLPESSVPRTFQ